MPLIKKSLHSRGNKRVMRRAIKALLLFSSIILCSAILAVVRLCCFNPRLRVQLSAYIVHVFGKLFTTILCIRVILRGERQLLAKRGVFLVCNHLGYLDGIVATALTPLVFIAKADIRRWPFFGIFAFLSDTIFIDRTSANNIKQEISKIVSFLRYNVNLIFFPEGTSSNGTKLLPFKSSFFAAPQEAGAEIVPLAITYKAINNTPLNDNNRDILCWYNKMKFFPHLLNILKLSCITIEVRVCDPLSDFKKNNYDSAAGRKSIRDACWMKIDAGLRVR